METQNLEWKEFRHDEYLKCISGFANEQGGTKQVSLRAGQKRTYENWKRLEWLYIRES